MSRPDDDPLPFHRRFIRGALAMKSSVALSAALGAVGFIACEFVVTTTNAPTLWYHPLERRFFFDRFSASPAMDFFGRSIEATVGGLLFFALGLLLFRGLSDLSTRVWSRRLAVWLATAVVATMALHVALLIHRVPVPLEQLTP